MLFVVVTGELQRLELSYRSSGTQNKSDPLIYTSRDPRPANQCSSSHPGNGARLMSYSPLQVSIIFLFAVLVEY